MASKESTGKQLAWQGMLKEPLANNSNFSQQYASLGGEVSSHKSQLKTWENDLREFKDINKQYTDQLIKVKVRAVRFITPSPLTDPSRCPTWRMVT